MKLLLIDQSKSGDWLASRLAGLGFIPEQAGSTQQAIREERAKNVRAVVIDTGFLDHGPASLVRPLRRAGINQPLLVLSPRENWRDMIECLDAGADDFLVKPARSEVIAARLRAIIRRGAGRSSDRITFDDIEIDLWAKCAWKQGRCLDLTRNEFRLLRLLLLEPDRVLSHEEIRGQLYADVDECSQNAVEVLVARLRRKVGRERIGNVRGIGYRFKPEVAATDPSLGERETCLRISGHSERESGDPGHACQSRVPDGHLISWPIYI